MAEVAATLGRPPLLWDNFPANDGPFVNQLNLGAYRGRDPALPGVVDGVLLNTMIQARRLRLDAVGTGLPKVMWVVIVFGAFISLSSAFFFKVEDARLHILEVLLLSVFIGLVIFMILSLDRPFRGDLGIGADSYQLVYDQLMKSNP